MNTGVAATVLDDGIGSEGQQQLDDVDGVVPDGQMQRSLKYSKVKVSLLAFYWVAFLNEFYDYIFFDSLFFGGHLLFCS